MSSTELDFYLTGKYQGFRVQKWDYPNQRIQIQTFLRLRDVASLNQPTSEIMSPATFHWKMDFFGLKFTPVNRNCEDERQALNFSPRTTGQIVTGMQISQFWQRPTSCCLELGLKTLLKNLLTAGIPFSFFRCDFTYGIKQGRTSPWGEPIEPPLLGPEVPVQLPVTSVSLQPEQSQGAPGTKPNPSSASRLLSMGRECFMGALSDGTCTDFWKVTVWPRPLQHGLVFAVCWL